MTRENNIHSIREVRRILDDRDFEIYANHQDIKASNPEIIDIGILVDCLLEADAEGKYFEGFHIGFETLRPQKQFALLRFGDKSTINIELKSVNVGNARIKKQLNLGKRFLELI